jgi:hypothetical protein
METVSSVRSAIFRGPKRISNTSTVALRVLAGDERGTQCLAYNWATLLLGDLNTGTWASRLGESRI